MLDIITLKGLTASGIHGVYDFEREHPQPFRVDIALWVDISYATQSDRVDETVSYADVAEDVVSVIEGPSVHLIETLADRIATRILQRPRVEGIEVVVHKPQAPLEREFSDVYVRVRRGVAEEIAPPSASPAPVAVAPEAPERVERELVLAFGGNQGNVPATIVRALERLIDEPAIHIREISPLMRTTAMLEAGMEPQDDYWNAVLVGTTTLEPHDILKLTASIEEELGRERPFHWAPRTIDIDIISMGQTFIDDDLLNLPHPRAVQRPFVLIPWLLADPSAQLPGYGAVAELVASLPECDCIIDAITDWLEQPESIMDDSNAVLATRQVSSHSQNNGRLFADKDAPSAPALKDVLFAAPAKELHHEETLPETALAQPQRRIPWKPVTPKVIEEEPAHIQAPLPETESALLPPLPEWNFAHHEVTIIDATDDVTSAPTSSSTPSQMVILDPELPAGTAIGPVNTGSAPAAHVQRRNTIRPTHTGMIPVIKRLSSEK